MGLPALTPAAAALFSIMLTAATLFFSSCGDNGGHDSLSRGVTVTATTGTVADIVKQVAGSHAEVTQLVPDSASPHSYQASAKDRRRLDEAELVVYIGHNFEENLPVDEVKSPRFALAENVGELRIFSEVADAEEHGEEGDHDGAGAKDPHVWMDPTRTARALPALARALAGVDPENRAVYRRRAVRYSKRLLTLDRELRDILAPIPVSRRKLVTSHDALAYFAERYDLRVVGTAFGAAPEAQAEASHIAELVGTVEHERVSTVFAQRGDDPKVLRQVAREAGVRVVDDLLVEGFGAGAKTYERILRFDAGRIKTALGP